MTLSIAVFSYNRGDYLQHCLNSIRRNMPQMQTVIYDDNSTDPATLQVLAAPGNTVVRPVENAKHRHGGLYGNMQAALDDATTDMLLFLQDDMQVVRPLDEADIRAMSDLFAQDDRRAFVSPSFIKGLRRKRYLRDLTPVPQPRSYASRVWEERLTYFDVSVAHVGRLRAAGWQFMQSEAENVAQAKDKFGDMPVLGEPFVFFCPEVPIFRNRQQSLASRLAAGIGDTRIKSFREMTREEVDAFRQRDIRIWPVAEDFLDTLDNSVRRPFRYSDVGKRWWLRALHKVEQKLPVFLSGRNGGR